VRDLLSVLIAARRSQQPLKISRPIGLSECNSELLPGRVSDLQAVKRLRIAIGFDVRRPERLRLGLQAPAKLFRLAIGRWKELQRIIRYFQFGESCPWRERSCGSWQLLDRARVNPSRFVCLCRFAQPPMTWARRPCHIGSRAG
jgi:hypothetical protein